MINAAKTVRMDDWETIRQGDALTGEKYIAVPTIVEQVQARGGRTAIAGTKSAPLLFDRKATERSAGSVTIFEGATLPESARTGIEKLLGPFPDEKEHPSLKQDQWTTRALTETLWKEGVPELSVLWLGEPDRSEHATAPGSPTALAGIKSSDDNLATVLRVLQEKGVRDNTDVMVVSDHGFSTIAKPIDLSELLAKDGFSVVKKGGNPKNQNAIRVVGNGGTVFFYIDEHDTETSARLVRWLQKSDFAGVIFSRSAIDGAFRMTDANLETPNGPDVAMSFRWNDQKNEYGVAGMIEANGAGDAKGTHGTLSPFDVHNILIASGPDFLEAHRSDLPSSNLDVAATIANLLDLKPAHALDGRVLNEALRGRDAPKESQIRREEATAGGWRQYLKASKVGTTIYIDEGNGGRTPE